MSNHDVQFTCYCSICKKQQYFLVPNPKIKTTRLCVLILSSLRCLKPLNEYFQLKTDIYDFITDHWHLLGRLKLCLGFYKLKNKYDNNASEKVELKTELYQQYEELQNILNTNMKKLCLLYRKGFKSELFTNNNICSLVDAQITQIRHIGKMKLSICNLD
ncbi:hypothetical protein EHI8A_038770 [Entamoeba histolytica HM-1:IMSS-B]|uniref:Uncharacterized protein n=6 Tax=Entamoeba TaxID=5758 RepID=B1N4G4_ENTH1|nr:hypothetical protein EHI_107900 [Entamoeba histolytica HM-1:IMSS]XP_008855223.1 hypothetical protein ENU1_021200 [Entamoeba nuttalli P19]EMD45137.1 Hypothetical protein EHI5A_135120 [Entamoeba histolytica KU27]EMH76816.1 hypothetical protein EHI8A_038770 [Entamoeba histolytica HM-1:IMSS-B]EMS14407.1 hypothetical protein KM1_080750 [Entamoeba histolytica HM-3:IMSS]ENY60576.1 hypothetical protein EHI7A_039820 [Entamoeba histolytica HM-1:IMSS-A]EDS89144.1 hypothetical protein EHI_107900 [Enta|eukprot:XP_008855223.1 hypothetical protein ENU1_021200 [Entamoeba nuttalli P19]